MRAWMWLALCWCLSATAADFTPPLGAEPAVGGERTQMLNLGSTHLSGHTDQWQRAWLEPVLRRLLRWQPTLITVEGLSGAQCEMMRQDPARFGENQRLALPAEKRLPETFLELAQLNAEGRLRQVQRPGRPRQATLAGDGSKITKMMIIEHDGIGCRGSW